MRERVAKLLDRRIVRRIRKRLRQMRAEKGVNVGDLERTSPFSTQYGFDRGGPIDRYYIEKFLRTHAHDIRGHVLEIEDDYYSSIFGEGRVTKGDILHVDDTNPRATLVGDLADAPHIPSNTFDCVIVTQTFQFLYDVGAAVRTCHRVLKPGGVFLVTVPGMTQLDWNCDWREHWYWSFTTNSMRRIFQDSFTPGTFEIESYGNVYAASTFLYGMGLPEVKRELLDVTDPAYQVIISVRATKAR
jgi:SAM-dependent methyltransferase